MTHTLFILVYTKYNIRWRGFKIKQKLRGLKECDPVWIVEIAKGILDKDINRLSDEQIKMLRDLYLDNLREGLKPKDAMNKAYVIVSSFNF